mmetsp:Transcript_55925/g.133275  ORF Transcript_55925/g.133275 Transcript_55925/m.133275 type:complete len:212 (+) Transcript_55925:651-1286(+)
MNCRWMPVPSQNSAASFTNSLTLSTDTSLEAPPGHSSAPLRPVSWKVATLANASNGEAGICSSPGGCMYFRLHSGSAAISRSLTSAPSSPTRSASTIIAAHAPMNSPATASPGPGSASKRSRSPPRSCWKKAEVSGNGTTNPSRRAFAMSLPSMRNRRSTWGKRASSGASGCTMRPRRSRKDSSASGGSSSTHMGTSRFVVRRCNSWATRV